MAENVLIRCDASKEIGLGHITRCLVLANKFRDDGHKVVFAIKNYEIANEKILEQDFCFDVLLNEELDYFDWISSLVKKYEINIFIGDIRDGFPSELITYMRNKDILTIAIDEPSDYAKECDLCFYPPHANIDKRIYKGKVYQGLEYVVLRPEFYREFKKKKNKIPNILLMMGGTDAYNYTLPILKKVMKVNFKFEISVVLNTQHQDYIQVKEIANKSLEQIKVYEKITDMSKFLNTIDFAIISFGTLAYELIFKKIPAIHIYHDENDRNMSEYFIKNKFALIGNEKHIDLKKLTFLSFCLDKKKCKIIETIISYYQKRKAFGHKTRVCH